LNGFVKVDGQKNDGSGMGSPDAGFEVNIVREHRGC